MATRTETESIIQTQIQPQKMLISAEDYQRMGEAGIFADKPRVELIDGEILTMSPISNEHNSQVDKAAAFFSKHLVEKAIIRIQGSFRLDEFSEPQPDIAILHFQEDYYKSTFVTPEKIFLLIEVAVKTLEFDRFVKLEKYASAGIPEYWIIIPEKGFVEVYRQPEEGVYREKATYRKEDAWHLTAFDLPIKGTDLLI